MSAALLVAMPATVRAEEGSDVEAPAAEPNEETAQPENTMPEVPADTAAPPADAEKTASGVAYKVNKKGEGEKPGAGNIVTFHFTGKTMDGQMIQDSRTQPEPPSVSLDQLPPALGEMLGGMAVGEQRTCWLPEPNIPGGFIVADIELVSFKEAPPIAEVPEDAEKSATGIAYKQTKKGEGEPPAATDIVTFHFTAKTMQGEVLQDSRTQPQAPSVPLDQLSPDLAGIIAEMIVGEQRTSWLPEANAPGGFIEADIELVSFKEQPPAPDVPEDVAAPPADAEVTESGLASKVLKAGDGDVKPEASDTVKVHYTGWETDGKMFDSSVTRGEPTQFPLGGVIAGWTEGLQLMVVGEKRRFWIPEDLAYGPKQEGSGRPGGMLCFDVELLEIVAPD